MCKTKNYYYLMALCFFFIFRKMVEEMQKKLQGEMEKYKQILKGRP